MKVLCRNPQDYIRQRKTDVHRLPRNLDPALHPLEGPREYVRALNATKLDRIFAKPFVGALSGHTDGVYCMAKHRSKLSVILSGRKWVKIIHGVYMCRPFTLYDCDVPLPTIVVTSLYPLLL